MLRSSLRIVQAGTEVAEVKGKDLIPAHGLAMSRLLETSLFPTEELTYEQAIAYLRKEAITLSPSIPRGYVLVTYKKTPLGFVKNIGNRANNLYPQEWRIRSGYCPRTYGHYDSSLNIHTNKLINENKLLSSFGLAGCF